jgi:hypothetical protein
MKFGWVEIYKGSNQEAYNKIEQAVIENAIRYRGFANKPAFIAAPQTVLKIAPSCSPCGVYANYSEKDEGRICTLEIKRRDLDRYTAIRAGRSLR